MTILKKHRSLTYMKYVYLFDEKRKVSSISINLQLEKFYFPRPNNYSHCRPGTFRVC